MNTSTILPLMGLLTRFGYKDFIPMFKAEHYDPQAWASLFKDSEQNM